MTWRAFTSPLNVFQSRSSGIQAAVTVFEAKAGSASSRKPSASSPARVAAAQAAWRAKTPAGVSASINARPASTWYITATAGVHGVWPLAAVLRASRRSK